MDVLACHEPQISFPAHTRELWMRCCARNPPPGTAHEGLQSPVDRRRSWRVTTRDTDQAAAGVAARGSQRAGRASFPRGVTGASDGRPLKVLRGVQQHEVRALESPHVATPIAVAGPFDCWLRFLQSGWGGGGNASPFRRGQAWMGRFP